MKGFQSMTINTAGVIERVKSLFVGHPALIQGFNQFLPPACQIDADTVAATSPANATPVAATAAESVTPANAATTSAIGSGLSIQSRRTQHDNTM